MRDLVIIGAGGHGRELLDLVEAENGLRPHWNFLGFLDDGTESDERVERRGTRILGPVDQLLGMDPDTAWVISIGNCEVRERISTRLSDVLQPASPLVHPRACVGGDTVVGLGTTITAGSAVTTGVRLGRHTHVNLNCVIGHDSVVGDFVSLSPGVLIMGETTIGDRVYMGPGATVTRGVTIGSGVTIGAGSVVLQDVEPNMKVVGVPGRVVGETNAGGALATNSQ